MTTNFATYAKENRAKGHNDTARRIEVEGKICRKLIKHALASGYTVSVNNGEEWSIKHSANLTEIMAVLFETDSDTLVFRDPNEKDANGNPLRVGSVFLVYGNDGNDVISNYASAALDAFSDWLKPVTDYADTL